MRTAAADAGRYVRFDADVLIEAADAQIVQHEYTRSTHEEPWDGTASENREQIARRGARLIAAYADQDSAGLSRSVMTSWAELLYRGLHLSTSA